MDNKHYVGAEALIRLVANIKAYFAPILHTHDDRYYTESEIDNMEFITADDIDVIWGGKIGTLNYTIISNTILE